eukprot:2027593-Amphidinium_carterae.1
MEKRHVMILIMLIFTFAQEFCRMQCICLSAQRATYENLRSLGDIQTMVTSEWGESPYCVEAVSRLPRGSIDPGKKCRVH